MPGDNSNKILSENAETPSIQHAGAEILSQHTSNASGVIKEEPAMPLTKGIENDSHHAEETAPPVTNNYLLLIAIDDYLTQPKLNNPVRDANALKEILLKRYCFAEDKMNFFYNERATKNDIKKQIKNIVECIEEDNTAAKQNGDIINSQLLIYFSGHGEFDTGTKEYLFALNNYNPIDDATYLKTGDFTERFKDENGCKNLLLIIDACYAGNAPSGFKAHDSQKKFSRHILMSSLADQKALDEVNKKTTIETLNKRNGSPFSISLCEYLNSYSKSGMLEATQLRDKIEPIFAKLFMGNTHLQKIDYGETANTGNGSGSFAFELKEKIFPPVDVFAKCVLEYLNFDTERGEIRGAKCDINTKYVVQCSVSNEFSINKLLGRISIREISNKIQTIKYFPRVYEDFEVQDLDIWTSLANKLGWGGVEPAKNYCVDTLNARLRSDVNAPYALGVKIFNLTEQTAKNIKSFCKELITGLISKESNAEPTSPFFIFLFDYRTGPNFLEKGSFEIDKNGNSIKCPFIRVSNPVEKYITDGHIQYWRDKTLEVIDHPGLKSIDDAWINKEYKDCLDEIPIMKFISCIAGKNNINEQDLIKYLF